MRGFSRLSAKVKKSERLATRSMLWERRIICAFPSRQYPPISGKLMNRFKDEKNRVANRPMASPRIIHRIHDALKRLSWRKLLRRLAIVVVAMTLSYHALILFRVTKLRHSNPSTTNLIEQRAESAKESGREPKITMTWVPYQNISPHLVRAVLAGEDLRFSRHAGIDWLGIRLAMKKNWQEKRISLGGSL